MLPEDIDKLFRDRLEGHAPTPPASLWNQLEEELQPAQKRPLAWRWAAAATVALLLGGTGLWLQLAPTPGSGPAPLAGTARPRRPAGQEPPLTRPAGNLSAVAATPQATPPAAAASTPSKAVGAAPAARPFLQRTRRAVRQSLAAAAEPAARPAQPFRAGLSAPPATPRPAPETVAATTPKTQPERPSLVVETASAPPISPSAALAAAPTGPIEVEVVRGAETTAGDAAETAGSAQRSLGGLLLRQARNAVRGDRVTLTGAGLPETVTVQARVAGRTLTKVIQL